MRTTTRNPVPLTQSSGVERLEGGGFAVVDREEGFEMADPEGVQEDRAQARDLELAAGGLDVLRQLREQAEHGAGEVLHVREVEEDPLVMMVGQKAPELGTDLLEGRRLDHQAGFKKIDDRHAVDVLDLQVLERGC